jgi:hypothetical protein
MEKSPASPTLRITPGRVHPDLIDGFLPGPHCGKNNAKNSGMGRWKAVILPLILNKN